MFTLIDWASTEHAVCVLDAAGRVLDPFTIAHTADGFERLVRRLARHAPAGDLPIAIERPDGRLVDRLFDAGHPVVPVKTTAIKAWREAEVGSGDAQVIADYLRLGRHDLRELRELHPFSEETSNQLAAFWPGAGELFTDVCSEISLAFLERYPTATAGLADGPESEALRDAVLAIVQVVRAPNRSIRDLDSSIVAHLGEHPGAAAFRSLPRAGQVNAAQMLAKWGDCREAYDGPEAVTALSGMAPVTRRSGKHISVGFRWACNTRFRNAMATFADNSRHASPWAAQVYAGAPECGADHPHAVRILARVWIRVIFRCWQDGVAYDPARPGAARQSAELLEPAVVAA